MGEPTSDPELRIAGVSSKEIDMSTDLVVVLFLTAFVHILTTMSYAMWIVGTRTHRIAISFSLFNLIVIMTRTANTFQAPLLAKHVELGILSQSIGADEFSFRLILLVASAATIMGAFLIPTFQRIMVRAVEYFAEIKSVPKLLASGISRSGLSYLLKSLSFPRRENIYQLRQAESVPIRILVMNALAVAVLSVGFLSSLYAAYLNPELRATSANMAAVITGLATVLLFVFVDPYLSMLTDEHVSGSVNTAIFRQRIVFLAGSRFVGTVIAQLLLIPASWFIVNIAAII